MATIRAHHIEDLYSDLVTAGQSGASIRKLHWALHQSMEWAHKRGLTGLIATNGVDLPPLGAKKINPPESDNVRKVIEHLLATNAESPSDPVPPSCSATIRCGANTGWRVVGYWVDRAAQLAAILGRDLGSGAVSAGQERLALSVEEAAAALDIRRAFAYESV